MVRGKSQADITTFTGGINACYDQSTIRDNQLPYMYNLWLRDPMTMTTRSNRTSLAWFLEDTNDFATKEVVKMFATSDKSLITLERDEDSVKVYETYKRTSLINKVYRGQINEISSLYTITECRDSNDKYIFIGTDFELYRLTKSSGLFEKVTNNGVCGIVKNYKNRLFVAEGIDIYMSKLRQYADFSVIDDVESTQSTVTNDTAHQLRVTMANGNIKAIVPFDDKLVILCERSMHILYGDSPYQEVNQFSLVDLNNGIGCISDETVVICNGAMYWLDTDMSVYSYNGSSVIKVSEPHTIPYGSTSYGGIYGIEYNPLKMKGFVMGSYGSYIYIAMCRNREVCSVNDTLLCFDTRNKVWWAEDGAFNHFTMWETDTQTPFYYDTDYLVGSTYENDILLMNCNQNAEMDVVFNKATKQCVQKPIEYKFETKTFTLGTIKNKKTLTNVWFQADANAIVGVCDYWKGHYAWDDVGNRLNEKYLILGKLKPVGYHNTQDPSIGSHEGGERQRLIVPKMFMQKINAFSIRVEGKGYSKFHSMEKEWRVR